jgi:hypothetical protein
MKLSNRKQIKTNYKAQLPINLLLEDKIKNKIKIEKKTQVNPS